MAGLPVDFRRKNGNRFWFKIKALFKYGVTDWGIYKQDISKIITTFQAMYYRAKQAELSAEIVDIEKYLNSVNKNLLEDLCQSVNGCPKRQTGKEI